MIQILHNCSQNGLGLKALDLHVAPGAVAALDRKVHRLRGTRSHEERANQEFDVSADSLNSLSERYVRNL